MTWVKICGITNLEDALVAVEAGADAVGFVFYEKSPRRIGSDIARDIADRLPAQIERVGIFVNESAQHVSATAGVAGMTAVQLHGDEHQNLAKYTLSGKVFVGIPANAAKWSLSEKGEAWGPLTPIPENLGGIVLDSGTSDKRGGTGKKFEWERAEAFVSTIGKLHRIVVAGGLTPENVTEAMSILHPWGVDVSSGVEARPGKKDPDKVRAFIKAVRDYDKANSRN